MPPTSLGKARGGRVDSRPELSAEYRAYMASDAWRELRRLVFIRDNHRCIACGRASELEVHHLTYARMGREPLSDLITLCHPCHEAFDRQRQETTREDRRRRRATARRQHGG